MSFTRKARIREGDREENNVTQIKNLLCLPIFFFFFFLSRNISFAHFEFHLSLLFGTPMKFSVKDVFICFMGFCVCHFSFCVKTARGCENTEINATLKNTQCSSIEQATKKGKQFHLFLLKQSAVCSLGNRVPSEVCRHARTLLGSRWW